MRPAELSGSSSRPIPVPHVGPGLETRRPCRYRFARDAKGTRRVPSYATHSTLPRLNRTHFREPERNDLLWPHLSVRYGRGPRFEAGRRPCPLNGLASQDPSTQPRRASGRGGGWMLVAGTAAAGGCREPSPCGHLLGSRLGHRRRNACLLSSRAHGNDGVVEADVP